MPTLSGKLDSGHVKRSASARIARTCWNSCEWESSTAPGLISGWLPWKKMTCFINLLKWKKDYHMKGKNKIRMPKNCRGGGKISVLVGKHVHVMLFYPRKRQRSGLRCTIDWCGFGPGTVASTHSRNSIWICFSQVSLSDKFGCPHPRSASGAMHPSVHPIVLRQGGSLRQLRLRVLNKRHRPDGLRPGVPWATIVAFAPLKYSYLSKTFSR